MRLRLHPQGQGCIFKRKSARSFCSFESEGADGRAAASVRLVGVNCWSSFGQFGDSGRSGAGLNPGREGLIAQTSAANRPIVTTTWITGPRDDPELCPAVPDLVEFDFVEDIRILAF